MNPHFNADSKPTTMRTQPHLQPVKSSNRRMPGRWLAVSNLPAIWAALLLGLVLSCATRHASAASATPPDRMSYQGFLVDANGVALATNLPANYPIVFRIYDASSGGAILWSEQQTVTVDKGNFSVVLGEGSAVSGEANPALSSVFTGTTASDRYLGVTVTINGTSMTLAPRLRWLPSPYAFAATKAMSIDAQAPSRLSDNKLYLSTGTDANNGLGYFSSFAGVSLGGPALFGSSGGALGTVANGTNQTAALRWASSNVFIAGNLGIGTTNPQTPFHVQMPGQGDFAYVANGFANYLQFGNGSFSGAKDVHFTSPSAGIIYMTMKSSGNIGIGTSTPSTMLQIGQGANAGPGGLKINTGWLNPADYTEARPFEVQVRGSTYMAVNTQGFVGIGTTSPRVPLEVGGYVSYPLTGSPDGFTSANGFNGTPPLGTDAGGNFNVSILASGWVAGAGIVANSDRRIKDVVGQSDPVKDLEIIQKLRVTDYRMLDKAASGNRVHRGFIAQEVEALVPDAVSSSRNFIPDIYSLPSSMHYAEARQTLAVTMPKPHQLKAGDRVRLIAEGSKFMELSVTEVPSATEFLVGKVEKSPVNIFVYGKEVPDFRTLNYDQLFTTGIGAIQELARQVQALKKSEARVAELEQKTSKLVALEGEVAELGKKASKVDALEGQVTELRKLVARLVAAAPSAPGRVADASVNETASVKP